MKLQKKQLEVFYLTLKGTEGVLKLSEGRVRDAFMKPLTEALTTFEADRKVIYEKFCTKKEDGTPDTDDGNYHFDTTILPEVNAELKILLDEEVELTAPVALKEILERSSYTPKIGESEIIDDILSKI